MLNDVLSLNFVQSFYSKVIGVLSTTTHSLQYLSDHNIISFINRITNYNGNIEIVPNKNEFQQPGFFGLISLITGAYIIFTGIYLMYWLVSRRLRNKSLLQYITPDVSGVFSSILHILMNSNLWTSIIIRSPSIDSNYSRPRRLTVLITTILSILLTNSVFIIHLDRDVMQYNSVNFMTLTYSFVIAIVCESTCRAVLGTLYSIIEQGESSNSEEQEHPEGQSTKISDARVSIVYHSIKARISKREELLSSRNYSPSFVFKLDHSIDKFLEGFIENFVDNLTRAVGFPIIAILLLNIFVFIFLWFVILVPLFWWSAMRYGAISADYLEFTTMFYPTLIIISGMIAIHLTGWKVNCCNRQEFKGIESMKLRFFHLGVSIFFLVLMFVILSLINYVDNSYYAIFGVVFTGVNGLIFFASFVAHYITSKRCHNSKGFISKILGRLFGYALIGLNAVMIGITVYCCYCLHTQVQFEGFVALTVMCFVYHLLFQLIAMPLLNLAVYGLLYPFLHLTRVYI